MKKIILLAFALSGMAALVYEVVWTRFLVLIFGSTVYAVSTMLSSFMAGLALGSFLAAKYIHRIKNLTRAFALLELGIGIYGLLFISLLALLQQPFFLIYQSFKSSFFLFSAAQFLLLFLVMLIPTTLMGATFPVVSKLYADAKTLGKDVGYVYSVNSLGAVIGPFIAGFMLIPLIGVTKTNIFAAFLNIAAALLILNAEKLRLYSLLFLAPLLLGFYITPQPLYQNIYALAGAQTFKVPPKLPDKILFYEEGAYSTVAVTESSGVLSLRINGRADASTARDDMSMQLLSGYLPMLLYQNASSVLVIGLGGGFTLGAVKNFDVSSIDVAEIDPAVVEAEKFFSAHNNDALSDARVNLILADARNYLALGDKKYDVITSEPSHPFVSSVSHLFTKEFFELTKEHLSENGIFAQWVPLFYLTPDDFKIVLKTFSSVYPYAEVWMPHPANVILLGTKAPKQLDFDAFNRQFYSEKISSDMRKIKINSVEDFISLLVLEQDEVKAIAAEANAINTDDHPIIEFRAPERLLSIPRETPLFILNYGGKK